MVAIKFEYKNKYKSEEAVGRVGISLLTHPFDYAKILIQLGYEPFPPYVSNTIFLRKRLTLPSMFSYLRLIRDEDGFFGLYRGIQYKIAYTLLNGFIITNGNGFFEELENNNDSDIKGELSKKTEEKHNIYKLLKQIKRQTIIKVAAVTITYPLHVLVIRSCAEFIGKETTYTSLLSGLQEIYNKEGLLGFYSGFLPRLLGECLFIWTSQTILYFIDDLIETDSNIKTYLGTTISLVVQSLYYPFHVVSTVMSVNGSKTLVIAQTEPEFLSWVDCWRHLSALGQLKRGSSLLWRYPYEPKRPSPIEMNRQWRLTN